MTCIFSDKNYASWAKSRLESYSSCTSSRTQADFNKSGLTIFRKIRLDITSDGITIDRADAAYATHTGINKSPLPYGSAGDCHSAHSCEEARKGDFKIDLSGEHGAEINWLKTGEWKANAWVRGNAIVDFKKTKNSVSARCGGWCGACEPSTKIYLKPKD